MASVASAARFRLKASSGVSGSTVSVLSVANPSCSSRIAAWADDYAPTLATFSYSPDEMTDTVLQTLEKARDSGSYLDDPDWLRDWVYELLLGRDPR